MDLYNDLIDNNVIIKQKCVLKSGMESDYYVDIKKSISIPNLFTKIIDKLYNNLTMIENIESYSILGIPYSGIPFASVLAYRLNIPLLLLRLETKNYGTKKRIEGDIINKNVILIEDVMTTGLSIFETIDIVTSLGLNVKYVHTVFQRGKLDHAKFSEIGINYNYLTKMYDYNTNFENKYNNSLMKLEELQSFNNIYKRLLDIMVIKKSSIILSVDVSDPDKFKYIILKCSDHIVGVKVHLDIFSDEHREDIRDFLTKTKLERNFVVIEDRKFADICATSIKQMNALKTHHYADILICHGITGFEFVNHSNLPIIIVAQLSNYGNLITPHYTRECIKAAFKNKKIIGFVSQSDLGYNKTIYFKPGTKIDEDICEERSDTNYQCRQILKRKDQYDQKYSGKTNGIDFYIVGRAITDAEDIEEECIRYQDYF